LCCSDAGCVWTNVGSIKDGMFLTYTSPSPVPSSPAPVRQESSPIAGDVCKVVHETGHGPSSLRKCRCLWHSACSLTATETPCVPYLLHPLVPSHPTSFVCLSPPSGSQAVIAPGVVPVGHGTRGASAPKFVPELVSPAPPSRVKGSPYPRGDLHRAYIRPAVGYTPTGVSYHHLPSLHRQPPAVHRNSAA